MAKLRLWPCTFDRLTPGHRERKVWTLDRGSRVRFYPDNVTSIEYSATADRPSVSESFTHDMQGRVMTHMDREGALTTNAYGDGQTGLVTQIYLPGRSSPHQKQYNTYGNPTHETLPRGGDTVTAYDRMQQVTSVTPPAGDESTPTQMTYEADGLTKTISGPGGARTTNTFDELSRLISATTTNIAGPSPSSKVFYDAEGNMVMSIDPNGSKRKAKVDALGRPLEETLEGLTGGSVLLKTTKQYSGNGWLTLVETGGIVDKFKWTGRGNLLEHTTPMTNIVDHNVIDNSGRLTSSYRTANDTVVSGSSTEYTERYEVNKVTRTPSASGVQGIGPLDTVLKRNQNGDVTDITDPEGRKRSTVYDVARRSTEVKDHFGNTLQKTKYNDDDLVEQIQVAHPKTNQLVTAVDRTFNQLGQVKSARDVYGNESRYTYNDQGNVKRVERPGGGTVTYEYDSFGHVITEVVDSGIGGRLITLREYDANGNLTRLSDPRSNVYVFRYDTANRLEEMQYPGNGIERWHYDNKGRLQTHTDRNGKVATYTFDDLDRLTRETHRLGSGSNSPQVADIERGYDGASNLLFVWDHQTDIKVSYINHDEHNRPLDVLVTLSASSAPATHSYVRFETSAGGGGYDKNGNILSVITAEGDEYHYSYDSNNRMTGITRIPSGGGPSTVVASIGYSTSGYRQDMILAGGVTHQYDYDAKGRLLSTWTTRPDGGLLSRYDYEYNANDLRTKAKLFHLGAEIGYTYDLADRLMDEEWTGNANLTSCANIVVNVPLGNVSPLQTAPLATGARIDVGPLSSVPVYEAHWTYDPGGNRLTQRERKGGGVEEYTSYQYDGDNRLTFETGPQGVTSYSYDAEGNLRSRFSPSEEERWSYDYGNRAVTYRKGPLSVLQASFLYQFDPTGNRLSKVNLMSQQEDWFKYDGQNVSGDYARATGGTLTKLRGYVNGGTIDSKIARIDLEGGVEKTRYYAGDAIGSVHEVVDSTGQVLTQQLSTAWGRILPNFTGITTISDRHGIAQRERDEESGLVYMRARMYDPRIGRFIQNDPIIGNRPSVHYAYCSNNPIMRSDPSGLQERRRKKPILRQVGDCSVLEWIEEGPPEKGGGGKPIEKEAYGEKYICTCPDDTLLGVSVGRNSWTMCKCWHGKLSERNEYQRQLTTYKSTGRLIVKLTDEGLSFHPGSATLRFVGQWDSGTTLSGEPISGGKAVLELAVATGGYLVFKAIGDWAGELKAGTAEGLPEMPAEGPSRMERVIAERVGEIKAELKEAGSYSETYSVAAVKSPNSPDVYYVVSSRSPYGRPGDVSLSAGERLVGRRISGVDAEQKIFNWAKAEGNRVVGIGATTNMCAECQLTTFSLPYPVKVVTGIRPIKILKVEPKDPSLNVEDVLPKLNEQK